jgi:hypothetical protein
MELLKQIIINLLSSALWDWLRNLFLRVGYLKNILSIFFKEMDVVLKTFIETRDFEKELVASHTLTVIKKNLLFNLVPKES